MSESENELPNWIQEKLPSIDEDQRSGVDLFQYARILYQLDDPWISPSTTAAIVDESKPTARDKLNALVKLGIAGSQDALDGKIYFIHEYDSEYPIPPDVTVVDEDQAAMTLTEVMDSAIGKGILISGSAALFGALIIVGEAFNEMVWGELTFLPEYIYEYSLAAGYGMLILACIAALVTMALAFRRFNKQNQPEIELLGYSSPSEPES